MSSRSRRTSTQVRDPVWGSRMRGLSGSLFDRLALDDEGEVVRSSGDTVDAKVRSIKQNLARVLNVRAGGAGAAPELGVVDFNDCALQSADLARAAAESIRKCILRYEPRLGSVTVEHVSDPDRPLVLQFSIAAQIPVSNSRESVRIDILMEEGRSCRVL